MGTLFIFDISFNVQTSSAEITPTVGFQVEEFSKNNINFTVYDMSGQGRYRSLWEHYYTDVEAIIFVLDSTDRLRICVAKDELIQLLSHEEIMKTKAPVLFFANKVEFSTSWWSPDKKAESYLYYPILKIAPSIFSVLKK